MSSADSRATSPLKRKRKHKYPLIQPHQTIEEFYAERVKIWKKDLTKDMTTNDREGFDDPHNVADCAQTIYENMRKEELESMVDPKYLSKVQTVIKDTSRAFLIEWIIDVHRKFRLVPEALYVTIHVIDQFLSK